MSRTAEPQPSIHRIAIVGAGTIGASWAALFLARGMDAVVSHMRIVYCASVVHAIPQAVLTPSTRT